MSRDLLSRYVNELIKEDLESFMKSTQRLDYGGGMMVGTNFQKNDRPHAWDQSRKVKQAWRAAADHQFFKGLTKVHWISGDTSQKLSLDYLFSPGSRKNELSTTLYTNDDDVSSAWGDVGIEVQGHVTVAANDMDELYTSYSSRARDQGFHKNSGTPKRPGSFSSRRAKNYILDAASFKGYGDNEAVIDNWKPVAIRVWTRDPRRWPYGDADFLRSYSNQYNLPILDSRGNVVEAV